MPAKKTDVAPEDLLDQMGDGVSEDADTDDLLDQVEEDDSEGWVPTQRDEGISGIVVKVGKTRSDFAAEGTDPMVPTVVIQVKDGTKYRVIGFGTVLRREMDEANPRVGDVMAVKYFGEKILRKGRFAGRPYKHFGVAVRKTEAGSKGMSLAEAMAKD